MAWMQDIKTPIGENYAVSLDPPGQYAGFEGFLGEDFIFC
jgi:hypothetical protein